MKPADLTLALEAAAERLGIQVRYETLAQAGPLGAGGLCKVKGVWQVLVDKKATPTERAAILAEALAGFDTSDLDLPPKAREAIELRRSVRGAEPRGP
jgi:hypothetical protein